MCIEINLNIIVRGENSKTDEGSHIIYDEMQRNSLYELSLHLMVNYIIVPGKKKILVRIKV